MANVTLSSIRGQPRRQKFVVTATNNSIAVPAWAQNKGFVNVTGCGGGGGGATLGGGSTAGGGGAGAVANEATFVLGPVTTIAAVIGAGGAGAVTAGQDGSVGGSTTLTIGSLTLTLNGGSGGRTTGGGGGNPGGGLGGRFNIGPAASGGFTAREFGVLRDGQPGSDGASNFSLGTAGTGGLSLFGGGGGTFDGTTFLQASGFGAGGFGARLVAGGAGAPGFLILEFVEGF